MTGAGRCNSLNVDSMSAYLLLLLRILLRLAQSRLSIGVLVANGRHLLHSRYYRVSNLFPLLKSCKYIEVGVGGMMGY